LIIVAFVEAKIIPEVAWYCAQSDRLLTYPEVPRPMTVDASWVFKKLVETKLVKLAVETKFIKLAVETKLVRLGVEIKGRIDEANS